MKRSFLALGLAATAFTIGVTAERDAKACGGCFHPPAQVASDITDERMLLSVSPTQTTLYDQIRYAGNPTSFAWVLPIHGTVTVGLSADVLFGAVDTITTTTIDAPANACPNAPVCNFGGAAGAPSVAAADASAAELGGVTVIKQQNVGPYSTVQLSSTDPNALNAWLQANGFSIPTDVTPVIDEYVKEGFNFLAMKLLPNAGVQAMRPVRVTMPGSSVSLPLRMAAIGTGATVGITIWVVSDGRYEPQNFPFYHIEDSQLIWDWKTNSSNYTTLRAQNEANLGGKGWEIESSLDLNEKLISNVVTSGGVYYGNGYSNPTPSDPSIDYLPVGDPEAGGYESADQVRNDDIAALFAGMAGPTVRVTRMRSDIAHAAMTSDFILQASADQSELSNIRNVTQSVNLVCPVYPPGSNNCGGGPVTPGNPGNPGSPGYSGGGSSGGTPTPGGSTIGGPGTRAGGGGCVAAPRSSDGNAASLGALAGLLGLVVVRVVRARARRPGGKG
jgi:hypothetical protein